MKKEKKLVVFMVLACMVAILLIVYRYEKKLLDQEKEHQDMIRVTNGIKIKKDYTAQEIIALIKKDPNYLGDSVSIFENGEIISSNGKFNGTIQAVVNSDGNMELVKGDMKLNNFDK